MAPDRSISFDMLDALARLTGSTASASEALPRALDIVCKGTSWDVAHLYVRSDADPELLVPTGIWRSGATEGELLRPFRRATETRTFRPGVGLVGRAAVERRPVIMEGLGRRGDFLRAAAAEESRIQVGLAVPLLAGGELIGVLELFARTPPASEDATTESASAIGSLIGQLVELERRNRALAASRNSLRTLFDEMPVAAALFTRAELRIVRVNTAFCEGTGHRQPDLLDRAPTEIGLWRHAGEATTIRRALARGPWRGDLTITTAWGEERHVSASLTALEWRGAAYVLGVFQDVTGRRRAQLRAEAGREQMHRLFRRMLEIQEQERARISKALHDEFGQMMTVLQLNLSGLASDDLAGADRSSLVYDSISLVDQMTAQLRTMAFDLKPYMLEELGLSTALRSYATRRADEVGLELSLRLDEVPSSRATDVACYRIAHEAISNVVRHASAHRLTLHVAAEEEGLWLIVSDDGVGFDPRSPSAGIGLATMRERAEALGGFVRVDSEPGVGTTITARLPLREPYG